MWIERRAAETLRQAAQTRPALLLTGARQTGKSSLLRQLWPHLPYVTLDRVTMAMEAEENPDRFLDRFDGPVILDEVQYAPTLFREIKILPISENG
jgi:predicted AAA+ superfamily ATPase